MNDRYLFRAKRIDNGEWACGSYVYTFCEDKNGIVVGVKVEKHWIVEESGNMVWVDKDTICQCTGLKDKNGKLIWENDIVEIGEHECMVNGLYKVIYCEINFCYALERSVDFHYNFFTFSALNGFETSSNVIGNIFDNHELLNE